MARTDTLGHFLTDVADSIRTKKGTQAPIQASTFDTEIASIPSGGGSSYAPTNGISFNTNFQPSGNDTTTTSLDFTGLDTSNMTSMKKMFCNMRGLTSLDLSSFDTSSVTNMQYMFYYCNSLSSIIFGNNWDTSKVTDMAYLFFRCENLTNLDLTKWDTSSVTTMQNMFNYAGSNGTLSITYGNDWDTSNVTNMNAMFSGVKNTTLDLSKYDTSSVTSMTNMFSSCTNLSSITYGNDWDTSSVTSMNNMFNNCTSLVNADLSKYNFTSNLTNIATMFNGCTNLEKITFGTIHTNCNPTKTNAFQNCNKIDEIIIDNYINETESVLSQGILNDISLKIKTLTINNFTNSGKKRFQLGLRYLETFNFNELDLSNINDTYSVDGLFGSCWSLSSLDARKIKTTGSKGFTEVFKDCESLSTITFGGYFDTSSAIYMSNMFGGCRALTSLDLSSFDTRNVRRMYSMFQNCTNLETINFGNNFTFESIEDFPSGGYSTLSDMFKNCTKLDNNTLNQILHICTTISSDYITWPKTLAILGINSNFTNYANIPNLSNYQDFLDAGWTIS